MVYHPTANGGFTVNGGPMTMVNPFITYDNYLQHINYHTFAIPDRIKENLDFYPENGWELLHKNNGLEPDEQTYLPVGDRRSGTYYILYNRYIYMIEIEKKNKEPQQRVIELERK